MFKRRILLHTVLLFVLAGCDTQPAAPRFDGVILNGMVYDGSGMPGVLTDVAILDGHIAALGDFDSDDGGFVVDASNKAVSPGFINMLSWAPEPLLWDGRSQGDIRQGVTLEVFGEGSSFGPWNEEMKARERAQQGELTFDIAWTTLGEFLEHLESRGVATNVASFIGATTVRVHEIGYEDRAPSPEELQRMQELVRQGMEEGALGIGSSLIYAPALYADTDELIALMQVAARYGGMYISHLRSEGNRLLEAIAELITIAEASGERAGLDGMAGMIRAG